MDIKDLQYFLAVAREESITGAAEFLHMTQPPLSRQLKDLETELGKKLLIRGNRKITLTDDGMLLRKRAEEIIELFEKTKSEILSPDKVVSGDVYIGGGETEAMKLIAVIAKQLRETHPGLRYHLFSGNAEDVTERLDKGLLDFGILIQPADLSKYDSLSLPAKDVWGVVMRKDSPLAAKEVIRCEDLTGLPLICSRQPMQRTSAKNEFLEWFGGDFDKLNIVTTYNLLFNAAIMVEEGIGYAVAFDRIVTRSDNGDLLFRPFEPRLEVGLDVVWKKYQVFSKAAETFLRGVQHAFTEGERTQTPLVTPW